MAIKLPDPGNGIPEQKTGNDEWTNMKIVRDNFSNTTHAASRVMGAGQGDLSQNSDIIKNGYATEAFPFHNAGSTVDVATLGAGSTIYLNSYTAPNRPPKMPCVVRVSKNHHGGARLRQFSYDYSGNDVFSQVVASDGSVVEGWVKFYTTGNTTKEDGTGYLVASSPVLKVQHDSFEKVHEAEQLDIEVKSIKTGVYEITGTTGLRENDGWNLKPPKDVNGNVLCICEASEKGGVITLKTYKKKFDFETVSIVADYEQPTDIPEGATVMLRFNDLPQEQLDEPAI